VQAEKADPKLLAINNAADLVYHVPADPKTGKKDIWVFKADDPLKCRTMGKGQEWCIASSAMTKWYFTYRHNHGQTQYFIFDYNKSPNDPARYVNPGIGPEDTDPHYDDISEAGSEWVDERNHPDEINGYNSVDDYKKYLQKMGIPLSIFKSDPLTDFEKKLFKLVDDKNWEEAYEDPQVWKLYWQIVDSLPDVAYNKLNDEEKIQFRKGKWAFLTQQQMKDAILLYKQDIKKFEEWAKTAAHAPTSEIYDKASKIVSINPKDLLKDFIRMKGIISRGDAEFLIKKFGDEGLQLLKDNKNKFSNVYTWLPISLATGEIPDNLEEMITKNDRFSERMLNGYLVYLSLDAFVEGKANALKAINNVKPEILKHPIQTTQNNWVNEITVNKRLYSNLKNLKTFDDFLKEKLGWSQSFLNYMGKRDVTPLADILSGDYPDDVKDYIATHMNPANIPEIAYSKTKYGGTYGIKDEENDQRRREETEKSVKTFIKILDKQISSLNNNGITQIAQTYPHKQELFTYLKNKGYKLEELFWEPEQIANLIKTIDRQADSWPEVIDSMQLLGPEVLGKLSNNDIMKLIRKTQYYPGLKADTISQLIPYLKVTPENLKEMLYMLQFASNDNIYQLEKTIDPEIIKNADKDTANDWFMRRLSIDAPPSIFSKQQFAQLDTSTLAEALVKDKIPNRYITPELLQKLQNYANDPKASIGKYMREKLVAKLNQLMAPVHHP
jgi:hypothetical protein